MAVHKGILPVTLEGQTCWSQDQTAKVPKLHPAGAGILPLVIQCPRHIGHSTGLSSVQSGEPPSPLLPPSSSFQHLLVPSWEETIFSWTQSVCDLAWRSWGLTLGQCERNEAESMVKSQWTSLRSLEGCYPDCPLCWGEGNTWGTGCPGVKGDCPKGEVEGVERALDGIHEVCVWATQPLMR